MAQVVVELTGDEAKLLRSMQKVIDQNAKVGRSFRNLEKDSGSISTGLDKGLKSIGAMVTATGSVELGFRAIGTAQQSLIDRMEKSLGLVQELATAQQEAAKNLAGNSQEKIADVLERQVPEIADRADFSDLGKITTALGSVSSIVGEGLSSSIVEAAANVTKFKKDDLQSTATSTADIVKAAGLTDGREAMSLLLTSGAVARPEELPKLAGGASKAIYAGVNASPTQSPVEAAKSSAALFAMMSKVDKNGESAATASILLEELLRTTFNPNLDDSAKRDERLRELLDKQSVTEDERLNIERARITLQEKEVNAGRIRPGDKSLRAESVRLGVAEAKAALADAQKDAGLDTKETEELRRIQVQKGFEGKDPGTFKERLDLVRREPELKRTVEANLKGEAQFKPILQGLLDPNSTHSKELDTALGSITTDVAKFDEAVKTMTITAQQKLAGASEKVATSIAVKNFKDTELQTFATVDGIVKKSLEANPNTGMMALREGLMKHLSSITNIQGDSPSSFSATPDEAITNAVNLLRDRQVTTVEWGKGDVSKMSPQARAKIGNLQSSIEGLEKMRTEIAPSNQASLPTRKQAQGTLEVSNVTSEPVRAQAVGGMESGIESAASPRTSASTSERGPESTSTGSINQAAERMAQAADATAKAIGEQSRLTSEQTDILRELRDKRSDPSSSASAIRAQVMASQQ